MSKPLYQNNPMIDAQARRITKLNDTMREMAQKHEREMVAIRQQHMVDKPYADFYRTLQKTVLSNPMLTLEWQNFCLLLKLVDPDEEKYRVYD